MQDGRLRAAGADDAGGDPAADDECEEGTGDTEDRGVTYDKPSEIPISKGGEVEDEAIPRKAFKR